LSKSSSWNDLLLKEAVFSSSSSIECSEWLASSISISGFSWESMLLLSPSWDESASSDGGDLGTSLISSGSSYSSGDIFISVYSLSLRLRSSSCRINSWTSSNYGSAGYFWLSCYIKIFSSYSYPILRPSSISIISFSVSLPYFSLYTLSF
jgi:hypothetical protein